LLETIQLLAAAEQLRLPKLVTGHGPRCWKGAASAAP